MTSNEHYDNLRNGAQSELDHVLDHFIEVASSVTSNEEHTKQLTNQFLSYLKSSMMELESDIDRLNARKVEEVQANSTKLGPLCSELYMPVPELDPELALWQRNDELLKLIDLYEHKRQIKHKELQSLLDEQLELCKLLEADPMVIKFPLSSAEEEQSFCNYVQYLRDEKASREERAAEMILELRLILSERGQELILKLEKQIMEDGAAFVVSNTNMKRLDGYHKVTVNQWNSVKEEIDMRRVKLDDMWQQLNYHKDYCRDFHLRYSGYSLEVLAAYRKEFDECEWKKSENLQEIIESCRAQLIELREKCYCKDNNLEDELMYYGNGEPYTEATLDLYEWEIRKWNIYYEFTKEIFWNLDQHRQICERMYQLKQNAEGVDRYKNRGGKLLQEERERNKLLKQIPGKERKLLRLAEQYEEQHDNQFLINGRPLREYLEMMREQVKMDRMDRRFGGHHRSPMPSSSPTTAACSSNVSLGGKATGTTSRSGKKSRQPPLQHGERVLKKTKNATVVKGKGAPAVKVSMPCGRRLSGGRVKKPHTSPGNRTKMVAVRPGTTETYNSNNGNKEHGDDESVAGYDQFQNHVMGTSSFKVD